MNVLIALNDDEIHVLQDWWAERIGQGDEVDADHAIKRINQLERALSSAPVTEFDAR